MKAVIIAAGNSSRLWPKTNMIPKTLLSYDKGSILSTIVGNIAKIGIMEFVFILGYKSNYISDYLEKNKFFGFPSEIIINHEYQRGNGLSVLMAEQAVRDQPFVLSMSDHIVSPTAIQRIAEDPRAKNLLLVDKRVNNIFDIDDATKVWLNENRIKKINKNLSEYNGIDCGIFRLTPRFFDAMREQERNGRESISAGVEILIQNDDMEASFMAPDETWIDIDTPDAYHYALEQLNKKVAE